MNFQMDLEGKNHSFDLGPTMFANDACHGLELYKQNKEYGDLRRIFANLYWMVSEGNLFNKNACLATELLALSVFPNLNDYEKHFVTTSVTGIYEFAKIPVRECWQNLVKNTSEKIFFSPSKFNLDSALNAGIVFTHRSSGKIIMQPIPEYSDTLAILEYSDTLSDTLEIPEYSGKIL